MGKGLGYGGELGLRDGDELGNVMGIKDGIKHSVGRDYMMWEKDLFRKMQLTIDAQSLGLE